MKSSTTSCGSLLRRRNWRPASLFAVFLLLGGCAGGPYYGMSRTQWEALPEEEQARYEGEYIGLQQVREQRATSEEVNGMLNRSLRGGAGAPAWDRDRYSY